MRKSIRAPGNVVFVREFSSGMGLITGWIATGNIDTETNKAGIRCWSQVATELNRRWEKSNEK